MPDGRKESLAGPWFGKIITNPFIRPRIELTNWYYNKFAGRFWETEENDVVVRVIEIKGDLLIEIHRKNNAYTYSIVQNTFDEDDIFWCWTPMEGSGIHLFDTEEKAIGSAKKELNI